MAARSWAPDRSGFAYSPRIIRKIGLPGSGSKDSQHLWDAQSLFLVIEFLSRRAKSSSVFVGFCLSLPVVATVIGEDKFADRKNIVSGGP